MPKKMLKKNQKMFIKEMSNLIKLYDGVSDLRNKNLVQDMLLVNIPKIMNNFDKSSPEYSTIEGLVYDTMENIGLLIKFIKDE